MLLPLKSDACIENVPLLPVWNCSFQADHSGTSEREKGDGSGKTGTFLNKLGRGRLRRIPQRSLPKPGKEKKTEALGPVQANTVGAGGEGSSTAPDLWGRPGGRRLPSRPSSAAVALVQAGVPKGVPRRTPPRSCCSS